MRRLCLCLTILICACGGRPLALSDAQPDQLAPNTPPVQPPVPPNVTPPIGPKADSCVVAIRADNCCCPAPMPVLQSQVNADACLVHVPYRAGETSKCKNRCENICDCMSAPAPSRVAVPSTNPRNACEFGDECATAMDCVIAVDTRDCCACGKVVPRRLVELDPCLSTDGSRPANCAPKACDAVDCAACPPISAPSCDRLDMPGALKTCLPKNR